MRSVRFVMMLVLLIASRLSAQGPTLDVPRDTSMRQVIKLRDGSTIIGRVTESWGDSARVSSAAGSFVIHRANVQSIRTVSGTQMHSGQYWPTDPNDTRLFFAPTARALPKGEGYLADHWLFLLDGAVGLTDRVTLGGSMTLLPTADFFKNNLYFATLKATVVEQPKFSAAIGTFAGGAPFMDDCTNDCASTFGIAYGVGSWGDDNGRLTLGGGYGFAQGKLARSPMAMLGGTARVSRRIALVTENWLFPNTDRPLMSAGIRTIGDNVSWDFGFMSVVGTSPTIFVPWIGVAWRLGR